MHMANNTSALASLETTLDTYLVTKAPRLPDNWREVFVKFLPWVTLVLLVLALPALLLLLGLGTFLLPFSFLGGAAAGGAFTVGLVVSIVSLVLEVMALPGLFNKKRQGWVFIYWATLVGVLSSLLSFSIGGVLFSVLWLYLIFQVKNYYK